MQNTIKPLSKKDLIINHLMNKENATKENIFGLTIIRYTDTSFFVVAIFNKRGSKPSYHYKFKTNESLTEFVNKQIKSAEQIEANSIRYLQEAKLKNDNIQIGTILYSSWGYEQTNIDFYIVIERKGEFVTLQEIGKIGEYEINNMAGKCSADASNTIGTPFKKKLSKFGGVNLASYKYCNVWDGQPKYFSNYA